MSARDAYPGARAADLFREAAEIELAAILLEPPRPGWRGAVESLAREVEAPDLRAAARMGPETAERKGTSKGHGAAGSQGIYLRLSVTESCNLRCRYCRPERDRSAPERAGASDAEIADLVSLIGEELGIRRLRITGGEPLLRPRLPELAAEIKRRLPEATFAITTNGLLLRRHAAALRAAGIDGVNVSLDAPEEAAFSAIARGGGLERVLEGIRAAREAGFDPVKLNCVLLETLNGRSLEDLVRFAARAGCEIRFIELMPLGEGARIFEAEYVPASEALRRLSAAFEHLGSEPPSATARRHRLRVDGREIVVGFIAPVSEPFCAGCDRLRLDCGGRLFSCLRAEDGVELLPPLRAGERALVRRQIRRCFSEKRPPGGIWPERHMSAIGG